VSIEELFAAMRRRRARPRSSRGTNLWKLYLDDPEHGQLGYDGPPQMGVLQGRYTLAVGFEYAANTGAVGRGYTDPTLLGWRFSRTTGLLLPGPLSVRRGLPRVFAVTPLRSYARDLGHHLPAGQRPRGAWRGSS